MLIDGLHTILYHNIDDNDGGSVVVGGGAVFGLFRYAGEPYAGWERGRILRL